MNLDELRKMGLKPKIQGEGNVVQAHKKQQPSPQDEDTKPRDDAEE